MSWSNLDPHEALTRWGAYKLSPGSTRVGPDDMSRGSGKSGLTAEQQLVELIDHRLDQHNHAVRRSVARQYIHGRWLSRAERRCVEVFVSDIAEELKGWRPEPRGEPACYGDGEIAIEVSAEVDARHAGGARTW